MKVRSWFLALSLPLLIVGCDSAPTSDDAGRRRRDAGPGATGTDAGPGTVSGCEGGPLAAPIPGCMPDPLPSTGDPQQDCVDRINQFRAECQCLPPLARWTDGEDCANQHAQYDAEGGGPHGGFSARICDNGGNGQNECPGWPGTTAVINNCLQQMWDEGPGEPFSAHGHYINMSSTRFSRVACGFYDHSSGLWAVQNFQ